MHNKSIIVLLTLSALLVSGVAYANHVTLSGLFDGMELQLSPFDGTCDNPETYLGYQELGPIQVSSTGFYDVTDAGERVSVDVMARIYEGSFDPGNIQSNVIGSTIDIAGQVQLEAGKNYRVVIQHWCTNQAGVYGVAFSGPGEITGSGVVASPAYWLGEFKLDDASADFDFPAPINNIYHVNGPIRFDESGVYYFADLGQPERVDVVLKVYEGGFNPADTSENEIVTLDDDGQVQLDTGKDYYFVTYPWFENVIGEWHYALFPPGTPSLNLFIDGAWNNSNTPGQGILIDVMPTIAGGNPFVFLAWFTFDDPPAAVNKESAISETESVGDPTQRWLTAFGTHAQGVSKVDLSFENTFGGGFNSSYPTPTQDSTYGTGSLTINDCNSLTLEFDLPTGPGQGSVELQRSAVDLVKLELCNALGMQPGFIE